MKRISYTLKESCFLICLLFATAILSPFNGSCQKKIEIEQSVSEDAVPEISKALIQQLFPTDKVHWYLEKGEADSTFEAKVKVGKKRFSVEFSDEGDFQDAEALISEKELPKATLVAITSALEKTFLKFELKKIQKQYTRKNEFIALIESKGASELKMSLSFNYEIIIYGEGISSKSYYEYLFDKNGLFLRKQELHESNYDNYFY